MLQKTFSFFRVKVQGKGNVIVLLNFKKRR